jgi:hypothetical protein
MKISVSSEEYVCCDAELARRVEGVLEGALTRYGERLGTVEMRLSDPEGSDLPGAGMICRIDAVLLNTTTVSASHSAATLTEAIHGATAKLKRLLLQQSAARTPSRFFGLFGSRARAARRTLVTPTLGAPAMGRAALGPAALSSAALGAATIGTQALATVMQAGVPPGG